MAQWSEAQASEVINDKPEYRTSVEAPSPEGATSTDPARSYLQHPSDAAAATSKQEEARSLGGLDRNRLRTDMPGGIPDGNAKDDISNEPKTPDNVHPFRPGTDHRGADVLRRPVSDARSDAPILAKGRDLAPQYVADNLARQPEPVSVDDENREPVQSERIKPFRLVPPQVPEPEIKAEFDINLWKPSRENPGHVIERIDGYDITEDKYGISYLFRLPGGETTTDKGEHSGYLNWSALEASGRLKKGATYGTIKRRIKKNSNR